MATCDPGSCYGLLYSHQEGILEHKQGRDEHPREGTSNAAEGNDLQIIAQKLKIQGRREHWILWVLRKKLNMFVSLIVS